ncbi:MAG TPA: ring-cleaving dioxygenase [Ignavibacteria bacterium]|nr:ring-cleaving dioxygenase [Ignavibacteria bacterium]
MKTITNGIHHITAISGNAKSNLDFYTKFLGLKLVKKTVNFDDPHTYHLYYANRTADPGTLLTFFPWENIVKGIRGTGQATEIQYSVPKDSFDFWLNRIKEHNILYNKPSQRFDEEYLTILDNDGLKFELVISNDKDEREPFITDDVNESVAIRGFRNITLTLQNIDKTSKLLTDLLGYKLKEEKVNRFRFVNENAVDAKYIDLVFAPGEQRGQVAGGSVHHVAFRVKNDDEQMMLHEKLSDAGYHITPQIDRKYFKSLYFREPGGVLFEIATDPPGMMVDESIDELGKKLQLPEIYESRRLEIEKRLPEL